MAMVRAAALASCWPTVAGNETQLLSPGTIPSKQYPEHSPALLAVLGIVQTVYLPRGKQNALPATPVCSAASRHAVLAVPHMHVAVVQMYEGVSISRTVAEVKYMKGFSAQVACLALRHCVIVQTVCLPKGSGPVQKGMPLQSTHGSLAAETTMCLMLSKRILRGACDGVSIGKILIVTLLLVLCCCRHG
jgi:hypothetical protein